MDKSFKLLLRLCSGICIHSNKRPRFGTCWCCCYSICIHSN